MLNTQIGSYEIISELGQGGMGAVYLARHTLLGKHAAIKVLLPRLSGKPEVVERFFNEARAATRIEHRGIVDVYDFGYCDDGSAYIVMEHLAGETLGQRIEARGTMPEPMILTLAAQVAGALAAAHAAGIVHRDLKPDNIFLIEDTEVAGGERVKVLDFGIAKLGIEGEVTPEGSTFVRTETGAVMGSPLYMAPEQCKGAADVDARADIYALGCVMYHMATGRPPFLGDGLGDIIAKHIYEPVTPARSHNAAISRGLEAVIGRAMQKHPDRRYASMAELRHALDGLARRTGGPDLAALAATDPAMAKVGATTLGEAASAMAVPRPNNPRWLALGGTLALAAAAITLFVVLGTGGGKSAQPEVAAGDGDAIDAIDAPVASPTTTEPRAAPTPPPPAPAPTLVHVRLDSSPSGAEVFRKADGVRVGVTPFDRELPRGDGDLVLVLRAPGHDATEVVVPLSADSERTVPLPAAKTSSSRSSSRGSSRREPGASTGSAATTTTTTPTPDAGTPATRKGDDRRWGDTIDPLAEGND